jgi:hypothetical protein
LVTKTGRAITDEGDDAAVDDSDRVGAGPEVFADQGGGGFVAFGDPAALSIEHRVDADGGGEESVRISALAGALGDDVLPQEGRSGAPHPSRTRLGGGVARGVAGEAARVADSKVLRRFGATG